jgi:predicted nucleotidyltransferase
LHGGNAAGINPVVQRRRLAGDELDSYLAAITAALVRELRPRRVILFGSFARSDQNRASDLDVVVIAECDEPFLERIGRALRCCYAASTRLPVEALVYTPKEWECMVRAGNAFARQVQSEGRVLYDEGPEPHRGPALAQAGAARP